MLPNWLAFLCQWESRREKEREERDAKKEREERYAKGRKECKDEEFPLYETLRGSCDKEDQTLVAVM
jgi:hypothetical protein